MSRVDDGFRSLSRVKPPDLWPTIETREPGPSVPTPSPLRRIAIVTFALLVSIGSVVLLEKALREPSSRAPVGTGSPTVPLPPGVIVFTSEASDSLDAKATLRAVSPEGGNPFPVPIRGIDATFVGEPAWSRDGSRLAIIVGPAGHVHSYAGDGDLVVLDADGADPLRLTLGLVASSPAWSPDGHQLVFVRDQGQELVVVNADGSAQRVISKERGYYQWPSWSPDGRWIAFQGSPSNGVEQTAVFLIHPDGTGLRQLTAGTDSEGFPAWSPNGKRIAFSAGDRIWIMDADGAGRHRVTACSLPCVADFAPTWAPDGQRLAFVRQEDGGGARRLYLLDLATGRVTPLTPTESYVGSPSWRP